MSWTTREGKYVEKLVEVMSMRCDAVKRFQPLEIPVQTNTDGLS